MLLSLWVVESISYFLLAIISKLAQNSSTEYRSRCNSHLVFCWRWPLSVLAALRTGWIRSKTSAGEIEHYSTAVQPFSVTLRQGTVSSERSSDIVPTKDTIIQR
jgi:hypothetical protein